MSVAEYCHNCEEPVSGIPTYFDGAAYCCYGCVAGGPCVCTYLPAEETALPAAPPARAYTVPATPAVTPAAPREDEAATARLATMPEVTARPEADPRAPIPLHRGGPVTLTLHLSGMPDQYEILRFAAALDSAPGLEDIALVRMERTEAWFSVRALSPELLAAAVTSMHEFHLSATISPDAVEATPVSQASSAPAAAAQPGERRDDTLLPPRPRFRVFRPATDDTPATPPPSAVPPVPMRPASRPTVDAAAVAMAAPVRTQEVPPAPAVTPRPVARPAAEIPAEAAPIRPTPEAPRSPEPAPLPSAERPAVPPPPVPARPASRVAQPLPADLPTAAVPTAREALTERPAVPTPAPAAPRQSARPRLVEPEPATPITPSAGADVVAPDERPGGALSVAEHLTLVVYPFHSFVALNEFQSAVRALRGVKNTRVRRFYRGTLHLAVDYEDIIPLVERLQEMRGMPFRVVSESRQEIELVLEEARSLVAAGEG